MLKKWFIYNLAKHREAKKIYKLTDIEKIKTIKNNISVGIKAL